MAPLPPEVEQVAAVVCVAVSVLFIAATVPCLVAQWHASPYGSMRTRFYLLLAATVLSLLDNVNNLLLALELLPALSAALDPAAPETSAGGFEVPHVGKFGQNLTPTERTKYEGNYALTARFISYYVFRTLTYLTISLPLMVALLHRTAGLLLSHRPVLRARILRYGALASGLVTLTSVVAMAAETYRTAVASTTAGPVAWMDFKFPAWAALALLPYPIAVAFLSWWSLAVAFRAEDDEAKDGKEGTVAGGNASALHPHGASGAARHRRPSESTRRFVPAHNADEWTATLQLIAETATGMSHADAAVATAAAAESGSGSPTFAAPLSPPFAGHAASLTSPASPMIAPRPRIRPYHAPPRLHIADSAQFVGGNTMPMLGSPGSPLLGGGGGDVRRASLLLSPPPTPSHAYRECSSMLRDPTLLLADAVHPAAAVAMDSGRGGSATTAVGGCAGNNGSGDSFGWPNPKPYPPANGANGGAGGGTRPTGAAPVSGRPSGRGGGGGSSRGLGGMRATAPIHAPLRATFQWMAASVVVLWILTGVLFFVSPATLSTRMRSIGGSTLAAAGVLLEAAFVLVFQVQCRKSRAAIGGAAQGNHDSCDSLDNPTVAECAARRLARVLCCFGGSRRLGSKRRRKGPPTSLSAKAIRGGTSAGAGGASMSMGMDSDDEVIRVRAMIRARAAAAGAGAGAGAGGPVPSGSPGWSGATPVTPVTPTTFSQLWRVQAEQWKGQVGGE
ncbi:hypothetical protein BC828DRAFT_408936 [Blastocladiella britannica]|nr:hypothetical protein BC828DRAFT_408936 [Blastocladiella britannica]